MNSSKKPEPYVIDLDFIQDELRKQDEKKQRAEEARKAAMAPKITDDHVNAAKEEGHAQGVREGLESGKKEASDIYEAHIAAINSKLDDMLSIKETYKAMIESYTLNLLQRILPEVIGEALEKDVSPLVMHHVQKLQAAITEESRLILRINSASRDVLETMVNEKSIQLHKDLHIETDNTLAEGDITLHWGNQGVEALLQHSLHHAEELLASGEATHVPETDKVEQIDAPIATAATPQVAESTENTEPVAGDSSPLPEDYFEVEQQADKKPVAESQTEEPAPQPESEDGSEK